MHRRRELFARASSHQKKASVGRFAPQGSTAERCVAQLADATDTPTVTDRDAGPHTEVLQGEAKTRIAP